MSGSTPRRRSMSPGAMTARRFFRNRLAVVGLVLLGALFLFSFFGGLLSPYSQDQVFYRQQLQEKQVAAAKENDQLRVTAAPGHSFDPVTRAQLTLAVRQGQTRLVTESATYDIKAVGTDFYEFYLADVLAGYGTASLFEGATDPALAFAALRAYAAGAAEFSAGGRSFALSADGGVWEKGVHVGTVTNLLLTGTQDTGLRSAIEESIARGGGSFSYSGSDYAAYFDASTESWSIRQATATRVWDSYAAPSRAHPLGTDKNGMDVLTRLMYGGRVSLLIGFLVVAVCGALGAVLGCVAGYFGRWVDELIMRTVDVFYCIPTTPIMIILGALMDAQRLDPRLRILWMMLLLGFLGWPDIARLVRGQVLSLREQEFMLAAEAVGLTPGRRIFRHLLPNVIPQLIVVCTMRLGSTILTEATLSFLGLGVKFPYASWGNIMNDVSNVHVLTSYWFVWIPAGVLLVLAVLGFNLAGDGLRDAFDPRTKQ